MVLAISGARRGELCHSLMGRLGSRLGRCLGVCKMAIFRPEMGHGCLQQTSESALQGPGAMLHSPSLCKVTHRMEDIANKINPGCGQREPRDLLIKSWIPVIC